MEGTELPPSISRMTSLTSLALNGLNGTIPSEISLLTSLSELIQAKACVEMLCKGHRHAHQAWLHFSSISRIDRRNYYRHTAFGDWFDDFPE